ncbi:MAG: hypothetical protein ACR2O3_02885 [Rhizobiaceae bacterium]
MLNSKMAFALAAIMTISASPVGAKDFVNGGQPKLKVKSAQLAVMSTNNLGCPAPAKMTGWIFTTKPGTVHYMIARKGGTVSGPFEAKAIKGTNGLNVASFTRSFPVHTSIDAEYRILIGEKYGKTLSNWAPLAVSC